MKRTALLLALVALVILPMTAKPRLAVRGGVATNSLHFDNNMLASERRMGWTAGLQLELRLPVTGLGLESAVMFSRRNDALQGQTRTYHRDYIEIPVHVRYYMQIAGVRRLVTPFVFTGPNVALLCDESTDITWDNRATSWSWDAGFGVELLRRVQLSASYGFGLNKVFGLTLEGDKISGRDRCWTLTAAFAF